MWRRPWSPRARARRRDRRRAMLSTASSRTWRWRGATPRRSARIRARRSSPSDILPAGERVTCASKSGRRSPWRRPRLPAAERRRLAQRQEQRRQPGRQRLPDHPLRGGGRGDAHGRPDAQGRRLRERRRAVLAAPRRARRRTRPGGRAPRGAGRRSSGTGAGLRPRRAGHRRRRRPRLVVPGLEGGAVPPPGRPQPRSGAGGPRGAARPARPTSWASARWASAAGRRCSASRWAACTGCRPASSSPCRYMCWADRRRRMIVAGDTVATPTGARHDRTDASAERIRRT